MPGTADADAAKTCSTTGTPGDTTAPCPLVERKVVDIKWEKSETWCSEGGPISGTTKNYGDGEILSINVTDHVLGTAIKALTGQVTGNAYGSAWDVIDLLPTGGPSWNPRMELDGETAGVRTATPMAVRFIPNVKRDSKSHNCEYDRTDPGAAASHKVTVACHFELASSNFLLTIYGNLKYVRGWGKERLQLADATLTGGFELFGSTQHWGKADPVNGGFQYWDGSAWQATPAAWRPDNSNHFGIPFYKSGSKWVCRDTNKSWPEPLPEWPANKHTGAGNITDTTLATWKQNCDTYWSDKFDIKRKECKSTIPECCRYKTRCETKFSEVDSYGNETIILVYDDVRSDSGMWAMGDTRPGLAPHEFGHLLGAPDEYGGVGTTQLGVSDLDGLAGGIDDNCLMGVNLSNVKKRHYKGVCEVFALLVKDQFGKTYTYEAVATAATLASPAGTPETALASSGLSSTAIGAIIGAIVGAVVGAVVGFIASGGNPGAAVLGAVAGAAAGALAGAGLGSLF